MQPNNNGNGNGNNKLTRTNVDLMILAHFLNYKCRPRIQRHIAIKSFFNIIRTSSLNIKWNPIETKINCISNNCDYENGLLQSRLPLQS